MTAFTSASPNKGTTSIEPFLAQHWQLLVVPACVLAVTLLAGYVTKRLVLRALRGWQARSQSPTAGLIINALSGPYMIWVLILGLHLAVQASDLPPGASRWSSKVLLSLWILSFTLIASRLAGNLVKYHGRNNPSAMPVTTLTQTLAQLAVMIFFLLVLLNGLGISITPILTALGVGGLAVALALQDTLSNLFAGFYVAVAGQVRLGDYIKLNTGEEGYVTDIGWRSTTIQALANNMIVVPNNKLGQAIFTNFSLPQKHLGTSIQVGVAADADPDRVESILLDEAVRGAKEIAGMLADPAPGVALEPGFGDWSLVFTVGFHVAEFKDQGGVKHQLRKRILKRLRQEHIDMPFPTRTIMVRNQGAA